jgi:hypothetical protein
MAWISMKIVAEWQVVTFVLLGVFFSGTGLLFLLVPEWLLTLSAWSNRVLFVDYVTIVHRAKSAVVLFGTSLLMFWLAWQWQ